MKKGFILFSFLIIAPALLFAQTIDSAAIQEELQRLNQINDSLTKAQIAKDSLLLKKEDVAIPFEPNTQEVTDESLANFDRVIKLQEEEKRIFRNKLLLLVAGFFIISIWMRTIINKQAKKKKPGKDSNPTI